MEIKLSDPIAVMLAASAAFEHSGVEAAAYGGLVVAMYGRPRETQDADLAIANATVDAAFDALVAAGLPVVRAFTDVRFGGCTLSRLTLVGGGELNTVDLVRPLSKRYAVDMLARIVVGTLRGQSLRIVAPEDYIILKVLATRERDLEDAMSVVEKHRDRLDTALMDREASTLAAEIPDHDIAGRYRSVMA